MDKNGIDRQVVGGWLDMFAQPYLSQLDKEERQAVVSDVVESLRPGMQDENGQIIETHSILKSIDKAAFHYVKCNCIGYFRKPFGFFSINID